MAITLQIILYLLSFQFYFAALAACFVHESQIVNAYAPVNSLDHILDSQRGV